VRVSFVSLFPDVVLNALRHGVIARAEGNHRFQLEAVNPRDFVYDPHRKVDDRPFGGEPGMLLAAEPVALALESLNLTEESVVISTDPTGKPFDQAAAVSLAQASHIVFVCGHYEGIDQRVLDRFVTHSFSIGDYILTGGELPAMVMVDAILRNVPSVLGDPESLGADSHADGLLSAPNYTRPAEWRGDRVPEVLLSGDHAKIGRWRRAVSLRRTRETRPDLLRKAPLSAKDIEALASPLEQD
jgi:tRNA (guanine37-N1)-methyltransferase